MSEEERQAIIHLLDKQARYEYARKNNISFSDEDYEAYIIRQSMIDKDKEIEKLQSKNKKIQTILRTRARQDRKRKAKLRKLRLETTNQRLKLERLHSIIKEVREYIKEHIRIDDEYPNYMEMLLEEYKELLEMLDRVE